MDFAPHLRAIFNARGAGATYVPRVGPSLKLKAIRIGGGQPVKLGPVTAYIDALAFDVLAADVPNPVAGDALLIGNTSYSVETIGHPPNDGEGLLWRLNCRWGLSMVFHSVLGSGVTQSPPSITGDLMLSVAASAGASSLTLKATYVVGKLLPGDRMAIAGQVVTVTAPVQANGSQFAAVAITPPLANAAAVGAVVIPTYLRDFTVQAATAGYEARELQGGVVAGDRRIVVTQDALVSSGCPDVPKAGDRITFEGRQFGIQTATAYYEGSGPKVWELQCRQ